MTILPSGRSAQDEELSAYASAVGAYVLWGLLPLYFMVLHAVPAEQLVAQRIVWSVVLVGAMLAAVRRLDEVIAVFTDPARLWRLTLSATILAANWLIFIIGIDAHRVLEISFGYFINPLVSVALGTVLLGERLSRGQVLAVAIAFVAIALQAWGLGSFPWISLALAFSFGIYGFLRKTVDVGAAPGLLVEATVLAPIALGYLAWHGMNGTLVFGPGLGMMALIAASGVVTALPLILFARGVRGLPLTTIGILQYFAPSLHFVLAIAVFGEPLDPVRLVSFALIWLSLAVFSRDLLRRRAKAAAEAAKNPVV
ncbi:chloramphenicol-sensitive protein RarD [Breoghania corrubedonensis]|uniref:Chloramphenicol-sensitive protein RarD n=1 Tax=Breoghania corrubedonensis TaxID=665038 RepID=A0A2T5VB10_9HYPH|nr:EamA family transporter RarD [Breoghania corrubedonensis]PTW60939.1 chloramphenicol-sensitive protein RarD [Breoghania corrubedonensis]